MENPEGSPLPAKFHSITGCVFPVYHVLVDIGEFRGGDYQPLTGANPLQVAGVVLRKGNRERVLLSNLTDSDCRVRIDGMGNKCSIRVLDETNIVQSMKSPDQFRQHEASLEPGTDQAFELTLRPYAVVRMDPEISPALPGGRDG